MEFFTKCRDGRLCSRMTRPVGTGGVLFPLLLRLVDLFQTTGVEENLQGTALHAENAHEIRDRIKKVS